MSTWTIQESGTSADIKQRLSLPTAAYEAARDAALKAAVAASDPKATPAYMPHTDAVDEKVRQSAVAVIMSVLDEAKGDVHMKINVHGHSHQVAFTDEQLKSLPANFNKATRQVSLTLSVSASV